MLSLGQWIQVSREKWEAWVPRSAEGDFRTGRSKSQRRKEMDMTQRRKIALLVPGQTGTELTRQWEKFGSENSPVISDNPADWQSDAITDPVPAPSSFSNWKCFLLNICLFLAALGLRGCVQGFSSCTEQGLLSVVVWGLPTAVASLVVEHRALGPRLRLL